MKYVLFTLIIVVFSQNIKAQAFSGPESVEFDYTNNRWLIGNKDSHQVLARDEVGNLSVLLPQSSIGNTGPFGIEIVEDVLYVCAGSRIKGYNLTTLQEVFNVNTGGTFLNGMTHDNSGNLYVTDFSAKVIYKLNIAAATSESVASNLVQSPNGIIFDEPNNRCVFVNWGSNAPIKALDLSTNAVSTVHTTNHGNCDGIALDANGDFYISTWSAQNVVKYNNDFSSGPSIVASGLNNPADIFFNTTDLVLGIPNSGNNTVTFITFSADLTENQWFDINVFPNPTKEQLNIDCSKVSTTIEHIEIYDVSGQFVYSERWTTSNPNNILQLDISDLEMGMYLLNIRGAERNQVIRFLVE